MSDVLTCRDCGKPFRWVMSDRDLERPVILHMYSATCVHGGNRFVETEQKPKEGEMKGGFVEDKQSRDKKQAEEIRNAAGILNEAISRACRDGLSIEIEIDEPDEEILHNGARWIGGPQIEVKVSRPF